MTRHRFEIEVEVDDEAMAAWDTDNKLPMGEIADWEVRDLIAAFDEEIAIESESEIRHAQ